MRTTKVKSWLEILTPLFAIASIVFLETLALCRQVDGIALSLGIGAISGLGGYGIRSIADALRKNST
ncbi:MAG: hypothetical protein QXQ53_04830 [Candidatus Methanosuratincola sp.]